MSVIKSNLGWKVKDFRGITFEEIEAKFTTVWKRIKNFIPMGSKEEAERFKRKGIRLEQESVKKLKTSEEVPEEVKIPDEVPEEKVKEMTGSHRGIEKLLEDYKAGRQLSQLPILRGLIEAFGQGGFKLVMGLSEGNLMHALVEWKMYDTCGVYHVTSKDKEIFMLVEKDYPFSKGLAIMMICYKLQVENYSQMESDLILKIHKIANREVPTASEESSHSQKKRDATAQKIALLLKSSSNCQSKSYDRYAKLETSMEDVEGCLWCRGLYGEEGRDVAILKTKRWILVLYQSNIEVENIPTDVSTVVPDQIYMITILDDLISQLAGHIKTNEEQSLANVSLKAEIERYKTHVQNLEQNKEYDQCVIDKKCLEIKNKNLLIQNEYVLAEFVSKYICSVVLTSDNVVPISVDPCSNCDKKQTRNLKLKAKISKVKQLLVDKERRCSHIETEYLNLELKFQKYKECFENPQVCNNLNSPKLNIFFEINKLKEQLQWKDNIIRKLKAHINNMKEVSTGPSLSTLENTQLKEELTAVRIKNDSLRDENVSIKARFQELYKSKAGSNSSKRINMEAHIPSPRKETVTVVDLTNAPVNLPTEIKSILKASKSKSKSDKKTHKNLPARSQNVKRVENSLWNLNKKNHVDSSLNDKHTGFISKSVSVYNTCNECLVFGNHDECVVKSVNAKKPKVIINTIVKQVWKATSKVFASVGSQWKPTGRKFTLGDTCPLTRITKPEVVSLENSGSVRTSKPTNNVTVTPRFSEKTLTSYKRKDKNTKDTSTGSPSNIETMAAKYPVIVHPLPV
nr:hypothetical protein [Tanacetum cinerariifolium]